MAIAHHTCSPQWIATGWYMYLPCHAIHSRALPSAEVYLSGVLTVCKQSALRHVSASARMTDGKTVHIVCSMQAVHQCTLCRSWHSALQASLLGVQHAGEVIAGCTARHRCRCWACSTHQWPDYAALLYKVTFLHPSTDVPPHLLANRSGTPLQR